MPLYELALLGKPSLSQVKSFENELTKAVAPFGLKLGTEVSLTIAPTPFDPTQRHAAAALFIGAQGAAADAGLESLLHRGIPTIPVATRGDQFANEIPPQLQSLNGMSFERDTLPRMASALLECAGLLPRQRRVFVSYKRQESRETALQLFDILSARMFDVFLDTHGIPPAVDFQATLWHRLCDSDVLVMLDTPGYFNSRWTSAEFGRALAKNIGVLRIGWPDWNIGPRMATTLSIQLTSGDIDAGGQLNAATIERIALQLESMRSESIAVRHLNLVASLQQGVQAIGGLIEGVGLHKSVHVRLSDGRRLVAYPSVNSPTSVSLHDITDQSPGSPPALVYDHIGLHRDYLKHLDWLSDHIPKVRLVKACEIAWRFADWET